ncbi:hypothetical protein B7P43_G03789 [Cryptotermes secundus]|uniref:Uncharacterized protein n=1 Tax=Cryptotermes secundus TaxID=105785 RepID=A0A2J7R1V1_9NEOP|nr:hypothetical protein B7P43_G03789 [Cryptotermes secundus]
MFMVQSFVRVASPACRNITQVRGVTRRASVVSGRSKVHIPFAEKLAHGLIIAGGICFIPIWVLTHLRDYQAPKQ